MTDLRTRPSLLAAFRHGEGWALDQVYREVLRPLSAFLARGFVTKSGVRVPGLGSNPADHADAVQEVIFRAFQPEALLAYDGERDYLQYLLGIARNVLVDHHRKRGREFVISSRDPSRQVEVLADELDSETGEAPAHGWLEPKAREITRQYVARLSGPMRAVHDARILNPFSERAAAKQCGLSRKRVRTLAERMEHEVRELLKKAGIRASSVPPQEPSHG